MWISLQYLRYVGKYLEYLKVGLKANNLPNNASIQCEVQSLQFQLIPLHPSHSPASNFCFITRFQKLHIISGSKEVCLLQGRQKSRGRSLCSSRRKRKPNITSVFTQTHVSVESRMIREHTSHNGNINNINNHPSYFRLVNFYHDAEEDKTVTSLRLGFLSIAD